MGLKQNVGEVIHTAFIYNKCEGSRWIVTEATNEYNRKVKYLSCMTMNCGFSWKEGKGK